MKWGVGAWWGWDGKGPAQTRCREEARKAKCFQYGMRSRVTLLSLDISHFLGKC